MKFESIVDEFFETHADLLEKIKSLEKRRKLNLLPRVVNDRDEINFFSWLGEMRFGLFFDQISQNLKSECFIEGKTPDWAATINSQIIIAEVLRLNTSEKEYRKTIAENRELRKFQKQNPSTPLIIQGATTTITMEYFAGNQSKLTKKELKYRNLIESHQLPFIICVAPTLETFLFEEDFFDFFMGSKGFFKQNENFRKNVTGVLLNTPFDQFFYYPNEDSEFPLTDENFKIFSPWLYNK